MSSRLGKLAGLKPPPAPSDPGAAGKSPALRRSLPLTSPAAAAPATTPGSVASSPFMKPSGTLAGRGRMLMSCSTRRTCRITLSRGYARCAVPLALPGLTVVPVSSPVAKPAGGASSFGLAGKKMPMFKSITAAPPPPPPETTTPTSSSVNPLASPTPQPGSVRSVRPW